MFYIRTKMEGFKLLVQQHTFSRFRWLLSHLKVKIFSYLKRDSFLVLQLKFSINRRPVSSKKMFYSQSSFENHL